MCNSVPNPPGFPWDVNANSASASCLIFSWCRHLFSTAVVAKSICQADENHSSKPNNTAVNCPSLPTIGDTHTLMK